MTQEAEVRGTWRGFVLAAMPALALAGCAQDSQAPAPVTVSSVAAAAGAAPKSATATSSRAGRQSGSPVPKSTSKPAVARSAGAGRFEFDQRQTEVRFAYTMANTKQRGRFTKVRGTLDYDEAAPEKAKISASITAASLTTGSDIVDNELKGADFFNVAASPVIAFKSLTVNPRTATQADVAGEITVNGITKPINLKVSLKPHDDPARKSDAGARQFNATTRIQRSAFKMTGWQALVDDEIDIEIAAIVRPI